MGHIKKPFLLKSFNEIMTIVLIKKISTDIIVSRGGSRAPATSKMEHFVIIVYGWKPLTIITKRSILDVAAALDLPLVLQKGSALTKITRKSCKIILFTLELKIVGTN